MLVADLRGDDAVAIRPAVGDDAPLEIAQPQIEVDRIGGEDHAQPLAGVVDGGSGRRRGAVHHGGVGRPPAHVAGPLIEIAVGDLDGIEREIDQALRARLLGDLLGRLLERADPPAQILLQLGCELGDLGRDRAHLAGDHREAAPVLAGATRLDQGIERENAHAPGDGLDDPDVRVGEGAHRIGCLGDDAGQRSGARLGWSRE